MTDPCPACGPGFLRWLNADPARQAAWLTLPRRWVDAGQALQSVGQSLSGVWFVEQGLLRSYFLNTDGLELGRDNHLVRSNDIHDGRW
jgi:CRP-like cAMP-binding protein